jgi:RNA polymerase sigma-54 factor
MRLDTSQQMRQEMRMKLAPRMIQSMEILQLPVMALQERITQELVENPTLEQPETDEEAPEEPVQAEFAQDQSIEERELLVDEKHDNVDDFERLEMLDEEWSDHFRASHRVSRGELAEQGDRKLDAMQNMPSRPQSLQDYLQQQFRFLECSDEVRALAEFIIYNLDDNGYLKASLEEVARDFGNGVLPEKAGEALQFVQKLDPPGVGARDLRECLLLQITPDTPHAEVLRAVISNHLEDVRQNRLPLIQRKTGYSLDQIKQAIEALKTLNPRPGANFNSETIPYVVPDLVVEESVAEDDAGAYQVRLVDEHIPHVHISRRYQQMLRDRSTDPQTREWIQRKVQSARWLIEAIEQRRSTILKVARAIIQHQKEFLDKGPEFIQPLKMQEIADRVGVHVTTVSRAVDDKWIQTPRGIFPLKRFFGGGTRTDAGEEVAWEIVQQKLKEVIDHEDKSNPLSDDEIVKRFAEQGLHVARRTITKYRKKMGIPSSRQRKQF